MARNPLASHASPSKGNLHGYCLPKGIVPITIYKQETDQGIGFHMELGEVKLVPDPAHQYYLTYNPRAFSNDDITVQFHPQGFLKKVHTLIDDQRDEFIGKLIELGAEVAKAAAGFPSMRTRGSLPSADARIIFQGDVDPFDKVELGRINTHLQTVSKTLSLSAEMLESHEERSGAVAERGTSHPGVYCKPMGTARIALNEGETQLSHTLRLPHPHLLEFIEIPQAAWVKTEFSMECDQAGYPVSIQVKKPSTAMAAIELPLKLVKALISLPAQIFQLRIDWRNGQTNDMGSALQFQQRSKELEGQLAELKEESSTRGLAALEPRATGSSDTSDLAETVKRLEQELKTLQRRWHEAQ